MKIENNQPKDEDKIPNGFNKKYSGRKV